MVRRNIFASHDRTLFCMAALHGQLMLPFRAVLYTWQKTRRQFSRHGNRPPAVYELVTPPTLQAFAHIVRSAPWNPFTIPAITVSSGLQRLHERGDPQALPLLPIRSVVISSCLRVLVHHSASVLGSISRSNQLFNDVVHHAYQSLFVVAE